MNENKSGRTTRLIDEYIQKFFNEPMYTPIIVCDHVNTQENNTELLRKITERLLAEHSSTKFYGLTDANLTGVFFSGGRDKVCCIFRLNDRLMEKRAERFKCYVENKEKSWLSISDEFFVGRATGQTTRLADEYVQDYFKLKPGEYIEIADHYEGGNRPIANEMLLNIVAKRLEREHGEKFYVHKGKKPRIVKVEK